MASQELSSLIQRLEAVATRLEAAQGGAGAAAGELFDEYKLGIPCVTGMLGHNPLEAGERFFSALPAQLLKIICSVSFVSTFPL